MDCNYLMFLEAGGFKKSKCTVHIFNYMLNRTSPVWNEQEDDFNLKTDRSLADYLLDPFVVS